MSRPIHIRRSGFEEVLELLERMEGNIDEVFSARRLTRSARQVADLVAWLRTQPQDRMLALAVLGASVLLGLGMLGLTRRGPKRIERRVRNKAKNPRKKGKKPRRR